MRFGREKMIYESFDSKRLIEDFSYLDDWESRYSYLIALGRMLPPIGESNKIEANKVPGCMSNVWMFSSYQDQRMKYTFESDALIVQGLCAVLYILFNNKSPKEILSYDLISFLDSIHLMQHISPNRRSGFFSLLSRVKESARLVLSDR